MPLPSWGSFLPRVNNNADTTGNASNAPPSPLPPAAGPSRSPSRPVPAGEGGIGLGVGSASVPYMGRPPIDVFTTTSSSSHPYLHPQQPHPHLGRPPPDYPHPFPDPPPSDNPHDRLVYFLNAQSFSSAGVFTSSVRTRVIQRVLLTLVSDPAWHRFLLPPGGTQLLPSVNDPHGYVWTDEYGVIRTWGLHSLQQRADEERVAQGKEPVRKQRPGKMCGRVLHRNERTYTCKTCAVDPSCIICVDCFDASDHEGHEVLYGQSFSFSASCDCGDPTAWRQDAVLGCAHHPPLPPEERHNPRPDGFYTNEPIPRGLLSAMYKTITIILEYIISTLQYSPIPTDYTTMPVDENEMREPEEMTSVPRDLRGKGPWSVVVWADDKHTAKEFTRQIRDAAGVSHKMAESYTREIEEVGRKVILSTNNPILAFHAASLLQQIDIAAFLRPAHDVFREEVTGTLITFLSDLSKCHIGGDGEVILRLIDRAVHELRRDNGWNHGTELPPDLAPLLRPPAPRIDWLMLQDVRLWKKAKWEFRQIYSGLYGLDWEARRALATRFAVHYVRLFEIFLFHDRDVDSGLLFCIAYMIFGNGQACAWATERAQLYHSVLDVAQSWFTDQMTDQHLLVPPNDIDRSNPSPRARIVPEKLSAFKGKKGSALFSQMRSLFRHEEVQRILASDPLMFNRAAQFLNIFVGMQTQTKELEAHVEFETDWPRTFVYLGDLAKCARELGESLRHATDPMAYIESLTNIGMRVYRDITYQSHILDMDAYGTLSYHTLSDVLVPGAIVRTLDNDIATMQAFSFHHYINLLFAECMKHLYVLGWRREEGEERGKKVVRLLTDRPGGLGTWTPVQIVEDVILGTCPRESLDLTKLILLEFPLQKHAVMSHIRADLWRKNGVGMRGQAHHYRDAQVRDATLDQEFFALQFGLCTMDPLVFFSSLIDRFGLAALFSTDVNTPVIWAHEFIEPKQYVQIMEDFLMLCIYLTSDMTSVNRWDRDKVTRRYLIQHLGLGSMTYSELLKKLPERSADSSLVPILGEMADFREPTETAPGGYSLKTEFIEKIDPYWHHYSRNDQRKAIDVIIDHRKRNGNDDVLIKPRPLELPNPGGPWYNCLDWLGTRVAHEIVHYSFAHCGPIAVPDAFPGLAFIASDEPTPTFDLVLDLALHLAMTILQHDPEAFALASLHSHPISGALSTFQQLWLMQTTEAFKPWKPRVDYIVQLILENVPSEYVQEYRAQQAKIVAQVQPTPPDARVTAAARQKAIMANFAKQQASFAAALDFDDDEDMEEEEEEVEEVFGQCIVCQEDVTPKATGGMLALMQPCRLQREVVPERDWFEESMLTPSSLDRATRYQRFGMGTSGEPESTDGYPAQHQRFGVYVSACNHLMHEHCMSNYFDATRYRHTQQVQRHHPENAVRSEYLCPLCKSLGNMLVPLNESLVRPPSFFKNGKNPSLREKMRDVSSEGLIKVRDSSKIWEHHGETGDLTMWSADCTPHSISLDPTFRKDMRLSARMIERFRALMKPLSDQSRAIRRKKSTHMYIPDDVVAYTIATVEIGLRGLSASGMTVAEQVPETTLTLVKKLIGSLQLELDLYFGQKYDRTPLRVGIFARFMPDWYRASTLHSPLLNKNPLVLVVETAAIAPDLLHAVIHMGFFSEITRVMVAACLWIKRSMGNRTPASPRTSPPFDPNLAEALSIWRGIKPIMATILRQNAGPFTDTDAILAIMTDDELAKMMYTLTLPFLRRCAIIFYACAGRYPLDDPTVDSSTCEYSRLLKVLSLPSPVLALSTPQAPEGPMVGKWLMQWVLAGRVVPPLEFPGVYELARLPAKWEIAVNRYINHHCGRCGTVPANPALCLFCGQFLCMGGDCCAVGEQGECNAHMRECGGVVGLFVDIKRWQMLHLYAGSGSFGPMPYLDPHGELDIGMRRGHRQFMHVGRMEEVRRHTWLQHMIPHVTARKLELTSDGGGWVCL